MTQTPSPISVEVRLTPEDRAEARRVLIVPGEHSALRRGRWFRVVFMWVLFVALAVFFFIFLQRRAAATVSAWAAGADAPEPLTRYERIAIYTFVGAAVLFVVALVWALRLGRKWRRATDEGRIGPAHVFTFDEDGLTDTTPGRRVRWYWRSFQTFAETEHLFVIRELPHEGKIVPKRLFAGGEEEVGRVRELLGRKLAEPVARSAGGFEVRSPTGGT